MTTSQEAIVSVNDATTRMWQAWSALNHSTEAVVDTFRVMGEQLADAYAKDVAEWARAGHRTWKRIYMTPPA